MDSIPLEPTAYRAWWAEQRPDIPYGFCWCGCGERTTVASRGFKKKALIKGEPMRYITGHSSRFVFKPSPEYRAWWEANSEVPFGYCWCGCGQKTDLARYTTESKGWLKGEPLRFLVGHGRRGQSDRELRYSVEDRGYATPCWIWQRGSSHGYGKFWNGETHLGAHRVVYERDRGPIPEGLDIDHLCRVTLCVNPDHLEPVTRAENTRRAPSTKLTAEKVREIRRLAATTNLSTTQLGERFGITGGYARLVIRRLTWRDVD